MTTLLLILQVALLVLFSATCSGLNIALMALDVSDLRRKAKIGDLAARKVLPLRENSHLTLAAILLANVAAVSATSLVLETRLIGVLAGALSTLLIVVFGEILPQALFARHALSFFAKLRWLVLLMIGVTYVVSKPLQLLLDKLFGPESPHLPSRQELGIMIAEHKVDGASELDTDEIEIMRGALSLSETRVRDIMTPIKSVYWLEPNAVLDATKIDEIKAWGWSRIPILNHRRTTCFGVLLMKDLVDIDFTSHGHRVDDLPLYSCQVAGSMTALDTMFRKFINGGSHLIPIERNDKIIGIVTIEDLLEAIVGHEIEDETDRAKGRTQVAKSSAS